MSCTTSRGLPVYLVLQACKTPLASENSHFFGFRCVVTGPKECAEAMRLSSIRPVRSDGVHGPEFNTTFSSSFENWMVQVQVVPLACMGRQGGPSPSRFRAPGHGSKSITNRTRKFYKEFYKLLASVRAIRSCSSTAPSLPVVPVISAQPEGFVMIPADIRVFSDELARV